MQLRQVEPPAPEGARKEGGRGEVGGGGGVRWPSEHTEHAMLWCVLERRTRSWNRFGGAEGRRGALRWLRGLGLWEVV